MTGIRHARSTAASLLVALVAALTITPTAGTATPAPAVVLDEVADGVRVIVTGAAGAVEAAVRAVGGTVEARLELLGGVVADVPPHSESILRTSAGVSSVTRDGVVELQAATADGSTPVDGAGPATLGADRIWQAGYDGTGVGIAVLDTGVTEVADLAGRVRGGVDLTPEQDGVDRYGHGTPVASLAAGDGTASGGRYTGVAPGAHVVPVKIAGADGVTDIARVLLGLEWIGRHADALDIRVVNISLGSTPQAVDLIDAAVQRLWDLGLVVVVAAGNDGPGTLGTPAANTHVITVGSSAGAGTWRTNDDVAATWSATGVDADGTLKPDLTAPGTSVVVSGAPGSWAYDTHPASHLGDGYQRVSGTSFSTGLISGAAALALDAHPTWTPDEVLGQLFVDARPVAGTHAPTPWLPKALRTDSPELANVEASDGNVGATAAATDALLAMGPIDPLALTEMVGDEALAITYGTGWYGAGWYGAGWYATDWFGAGWYGAGWYGVEWTGAGWYGAGWYGAGWYGAGWYGAGWYGAGWYGAGWYGAGWF